MRRIVLLAPGAVPPWTEGRKIFVSQLADEFRSRGCDVLVLDGTPVGSAPAMIFRALRALRDTIRSAGGVDAVLAFPYGSFHALRGTANSYLLGRSRALCEDASVPYKPVFYSCAGLQLDRMAKRFAPALAVGRSASGIGSIHLGIRHSAEAWEPSGHGPHRLLFLCGYQQPTARAMHDVLYERGLADLLDAGRIMAGGSMRVTIAIPFLRDESMRSRLRAEVARRCPGLEIDLQDEVDPNVLFQSHDAFVFPYRSEHAVFVPTSLLEAMSTGIPVVAADHLMYRDLTGGPTAPRCSLHVPRSPEDLARALQNLQADYQIAIDRAKSAAAQVREQWTLKTSADEILESFSRSAG